MSDNPERVHFFRVDAYPMIHLSAERDLAAVQALYHRCADFVELISGAAPTGEEAREVFFDLPPDRTLKDKLVMGCLDADTSDLIAVLEMIQGYPLETVYWIGLFLLDPAYRRKGLGTRILHAYQEWARGNNAKSIQLGVQVQNTVGLSFWQSLGFQEIRRAQLAYGQLLNEVIVVEKAI